MTRGSADYEIHGHAYPGQRRADPRIARPIWEALAEARTLVNVGAGTGSYEPSDRHVIAIEPSATMRRARRAELAPAIRGRAEHLPLDDDSVDAALAVLTIHHWTDPAAGLHEMRRVARGPVVVLTFDPELRSRYWLWTDYLAQAAATDRLRFPEPRAIADMLGDGALLAVPIPRDCRDGFTEAYYARPEAYLDPRVRNAQSVWGRLPNRTVQHAVAALTDDLSSGRWDARHGHLRDQPSRDFGLRLIVSRSKLGA